MSTSSPEALASRSPIFPLRASRGFTLFGLVPAAWNAVANHRRLRRAEIELSELDDRTLRDIGITRTEIPHLVRFGGNARIRRTG